MYLSPELPKMLFLRMLLNLQRSMDVSRENLCFLINNLRFMQKSDEVFIGYYEIIKTEAKILIKQLGKISITIQCFILYFLKRGGLSRFVFKECFIRCIANEQTKMCWGHCYKENHLNYCTKAKCHSNFVF